MHNSGKSTGSTHESNTTPRRMQTYKPPERAELLPGNAVEARPQVDTAVENELPASLLLGSPAASHVEEIGHTLNHAVGYDKRKMISNRRWTMVTGAAGPAHSPARRSGKRLQ